MALVNSPGWFAVPTGVTPRFTEFWDRMFLLQYPKGSGYSRVSSPDNGVNRNLATQEMLAARTNPQWCYYLDDDHEFEPPSLLAKLRILDEYPHIDVLASLYVKKSPPFVPVLFKSIPPDPFVRPSWNALAGAMLERDGLLQVAGCGGGGLLVRRKVLEKIGEHWFETGPRRVWGPDIGFCMKLRDHGFTLYADVRNVLGHLIATALTPTWNEAEEQWYLQIKFGGRAIRLPMTVFMKPDEEQRGPA